MRIHATKVSETHASGDDSTRYEHLCFGNITVTKSQGTPRPLFGSALMHQSTMVIEISRAQLDRHLSRDWIHPTETIVRFEMSEAQWAQHVSSIGSGTGVPVTLERAPEKGTPSKMMPGLAQDPVKDTFTQEIKDAARRASEGIVNVQARLAELLKPGAKAPGKKEIEELNHMLTAAGKHFESSMGFVQTSFAESMENTVHAAKTDIEAFVGDLAMRTGLEALARGAAPSLLEGTVQGDANGE